MTFRVQMEKDIMLTIAFARSVFAIQQTNAGELIVIDGLKRKAP